MNENERWMRLAIKEAIKAKSNGEVPVGGVLVKNGRIIAKAHNQPIAKNDATAHAEIQLIRAAGIKLKNYRLNGTSLYVTLEPCAMCLGAIIHARIDRVIFGAYDSKTEVSRPPENLIKTSCFNHHIDLVSGVLEDECKKLLKDFFISRR